MPTLDTVRDTLRNAAMFLAAASPFLYFLFAR